MPVRATGMTIAGGVHGVARITDGDQWHALARGFCDYSYQQTFAYGEALAARHRAASEHVAVVSQGEIVGLAGVRVRRAPLLGSGVAYVAGGPVTRRDRPDDMDRLCRTLTALRAEYVDRRGLVLRVLAPLGSPEWNANAAAAFEKPAWTPAAHGRSYRTLLLDIAPPADELRAACSKYWRRNLRRAELGAMEVRTGTDAHLFAGIEALYDALLARKAFRVDLDATFYARLQRRLPADEQLQATVAEIDGRPVAGLVVSTLGDTCVPLILATDEVGLRRYAAYLLHWKAIEAARRRGARYFDLGGIDPEGNAGAHNFKKGLRGLDLRAPGPFECQPDAVTGTLVRGAEGLYRRIEARSVFGVRRTLNAPLSSPNTEH